MKSSATRDPSGTALRVRGAFVAFVESVERRAFVALVALASRGALAALVALVPLCAQQRRTENVVLVTIDGLRWQEVFGGADNRLVNKEHGGVPDVLDLRRHFWRGDPEARRRRLLPFFWEVIARDGQVFGDPDQRCNVRVTNGHDFSYPGYHEILAGHVDPAIDSNQKRPNPNVTVLEWLNGREPFAGGVAAFCSWDVFPFILNEERSKIHVNAGWEPLEHAEDPELLGVLNGVAGDLPRYWQNVRYDAFTFRAALEYARLQRPRVLYVALGETDDWAHAKRYDLYLFAARQNDAFVRRLWEGLQAMPQYAGKTSLVVTTDHGRGDTVEDWHGHGAEIAGCDRIWCAVLGPDTPALGLRADLEVTQGQIAATVALLLGEDYRAAVPKAAPALPGVASRSGH